MEMMVVEVRRVQILKKVKTGLTLGPVWDVRENMGDSKDFDLSSWKNEVVV